MSFEFLSKNYFDTTTQAVVNSNTTLVSDLFLRDDRFQYVSSGLSTDGTIASLRINFSQTLTVSRIAIVGTNVKKMRVYYNGVTANAFVLTTTGATIASSFDNNSEASLYLRANAIDCTSISFDLYSTQVANQEKAISYLVVSAPLTTFQGRNPTAQDYQPLFNPKQVVHELSDGSFRSQVVDRKFQTNLRLNFANTTLRNELRDVFDLHDHFIFCPFGTTTAWDEVIFPCIWANGFEFEAFTDNAANAGRSGTIRLLETKV